MRRTLFLAIALGLVGLMLRPTAESAAQDNAPAGDSGNMRVPPPFIR